MYMYNPRLTAVNRIRICSTCADVRYSILDIGCCLRKKRKKYLKFARNMILVDKK